MNNSVKQPLTYHGGKTKIAKRIIEKIPPHSLYCEPYCGGASVFFAKELATVNIINDYNKCLIIFYRTLVEQPKALLRKINVTLHSRDSYNHARYIYANPTLFDDVDISWAVWVLSKQGFSGQLDSGFCVCKTTRQMVTKVHNGKDMTDAIAKLDNATIENMSAIECIIRYDKENSVFFIDPPYVGTKLAHYSKDFSKNDLLVLLDTISSIKGKFILTMYPNKDLETYIRKNNWVKDSVVRYIGTQYKYRRSQEELIVTNY